MKKINLSIFVMICYLLFNSCSDTIDNARKFTIQIPINIISKSLNRAAPDSSVDIINLNTKQAYFDYKDKIMKAEIYQFNFWMDSLVKADNKPFDPLIDTTLEFQYVQYYLKFAKPKPGKDYSNWVGDFDIDSSKEQFLLGDFRNVNVSQYYRVSDKIYTVDAEITKRISTILKDTPYFFLVTVYSKLKDQSVDKIVFPLVWSRFDVVVRIEVKM